MLIGFALALLATAASAQALQTRFRSGEVELRAYVQLVKEGAPRAVVVHLHGMPGGPVRSDSPLAAALAAQGIATVWFNYRGIWGNPGRFSLSDALQDLRAAIAHLGTEEAQRRFGLGDAPLVLVGQSFGSAVALLGAGAEPRVAGVVVLAPCDHGFFGRELTRSPARIQPLIDQVSQRVFGPAGPAPGGLAAFTDDLAEHPQRFSLPQQAAALQDKALLLIAGLDDAVCPVEDHFLPLYRALQQARHPRLQAEVLNFGHSLGPAMGRQVLKRATDWMLQQFPAQVPGR